MESPSRSAGSYLEDRSLIFDWLNRLEAEGKLSREIAGEVRAKLLKFNQDLNEAHKRIRGLMNTQDAFAKQLIEMRVRAGYIAAGAGAVVGLLGAIAIEVGKHFLGW